VSAPAVSDPLIAGWLLPEAERTRLLDLFPPRYPDVAAHHVTHRYGVGPMDVPPDAHPYEIIGRADDEAGVEALVVRINGAIERPDQGVYHVTWSLDRARGRRPIESNDVIARGWTPFDRAERVELRSAVFD
jgi:hypothetical protein